jgi:hypothetical protein
MRKAADRTEAAHKPLLVEVRVDPEAPSASLEDVLAELILRRARGAAAQSLPQQQKENSHVEKNSRQADAANAAKKAR